MMLVLLPFWTTFGIDRFQLMKKAAERVEEERIPPSTADSR